MNSPKTRNLLAALLATTTAAALYTNNLTVIIFTIPAQLANWLYIITRKENQ